MRECTRCKIIKPFIDFKKGKSYKDGIVPRCKKCLSEIASIYYINNKEIIDLKNNEYRLNNSEKIADYKKEWKDNNRIKYNEYKKRYKKNRKLKDPIYLLKERISRRILKSFKVNGWNKNNTTQEILGCTYEEFKTHIENKFTRDMSWDRMGDIHIDHIIPISLAETIEDVIRLNHYTNLQPLWSIDNIIKSNNI